MTRPSRRAFEPIRRDEQSSDPVCCVERTNIACRHAHAHKLNRIESVYSQIDLNRINIRFPNFSGDSDGTKSLRMRVQGL